MEEHVIRKMENVSVLLDFMANLVKKNVLQINMVQNVKTSVIAKMELVVMSSVVDVIAQQDGLDLSVINLADLEAMAKDAEDAANASMPESVTDFLGNVSVLLDGLEKNVENLVRKENTGFNASKNANVKTEHCAIISVELVLALLDGEVRIAKNHVQEDFTALTAETVATVVMVFLVTLKLELVIAHQEQPERNARKPALMATTESLVKNGANAGMAPYVILKMAPAIVFQDGTVNFVTWHAPRVPSVITAKGCVFARMVLRAIRKMVDVAVNLVTEEDTVIKFVYLDTLASTVSKPVFATTMSLVIMLQENANVLLDLQEKSVNKNVLRVNMAKTAGKSAIVHLIINAIQ